MSTAGILFIVLFVLLIASLPRFGFTRSVGYLPFGIIALLMVAVMVLGLIGTI